ALDICMRFADELPEGYIVRCCRPGGRKDLLRSWRNQIRKFVRDNGRQPRATESAIKIEACLRKWERDGFDLFDKSTWPDFDDIVQATSLRQSRKLESNTELAAAARGVADALDTSEASALEVLEALATELARCGELGARRIQDIVGR